MTERNIKSDNWGQLLSEFGIEDETPEMTVGATETFDAGVENAEQSSEPKEKKSIFSRFPKINFFGTPPEVSLDSVIEGVKSSSLGGKTFTDNKLEKMPLSQEWADRQEKSSVTASPDALSTVASQIDALASRERPAKRQVSSMFDDPIPESEEFRTLKGIMGAPPRREESSRKEPRRDAFLEEEADSWQRGGRGRSPRKPLPEEKETEARGRGSRHRPPVEERDLRETDFEPIDEEMPRTRGRGRRGSRYSGENYRDREPIQDDAPQEEWSEVDAALQAGQNEPVHRGGRRQRYDKQRGPERTEQRPAAFDRGPSDAEENNVITAQWNVPSWDEAVGDIIAANITRHKNAPSGRGRR